VAAAIEDSARVNDHTGGVNFASNHALGLNLHAAFGKDHTIESAGNHYAIAFNLSLDLGAFPENYRLLGDDIALDVAVDAESSFELERTLERHALINETRPLFTDAIS
jgi:hypothetical protein